VPTFQVFPSTVFLNRYNPDHIRVDEVYEIDDQEEHGGGDEIRRVNWGLVPRTDEEGHSETGTGWPVVEVRNGDQVGDLNWGGSGKHSKKDKKEEDGERDGEGEGEGEGEEEPHTKATEQTDVPSNGEELEREETEREGRKGHPGPIPSSSKSKNKVKATSKRKPRTRMGAKTKTKKKAPAKAVEVKAVGEEPAVGEESDVGEEQNALPIIKDEDEDEEGSTREVGILDVPPAMATRSRSKSRGVSIGFTTRGGRGGIRI
jgi:hypothetical protein